MAFHGLQAIQNRRKQHKIPTNSIPCSSNHASTSTGLQKPTGRACPSVCHPHSKEVFPHAHMELPLLQPAPSVPESRPALPLPHSSEWPRLSQHADYNSQHAPGPAGAAVYTRREQSMMGTIACNCKDPIPAFPSPCRIIQHKHPPTPPAPHPAQRLTTPPPAERSHRHRFASAHRAVSKPYPARKPAHAHWQPPPPA